jgi:hypothetical protein
MCRVGGTRRSLGASSGGGADETPPLVIRTAYCFGRTPVGGQFGWGATRSKRYQARPMATSDRSGIGRRVQGQKVALHGWAQQPSVL